MPEKKGGQSESLVVNADVDTVWETLLDFESYPEWMSGVDEIEVLAEDEEGLATEVRYRVDAVVMKLNYVLTYSYDEDGLKIEIGYKEGDLDDVNASYTFEPVDDESTKVTYLFDVAYSLPKGLRGPVVKRMLKQVDKRVMKSALKDLKSRAESD
jgi:carbon monoxide dehydrogenase subunit G